LRHGEEEEVLAALRRLSQQEPTKRELIEEKLQYLTKRREMIRYEKFVKTGYTIGSGSVESANKLVIQARLKQAGMHWARRNINPIPAREFFICEDLSM
ncbi:MAG: hypothetical protein SF339_05720, partial [Blastocatellia bacterium]|nr:hypothetical protein [Blastocatellia bacterium]